MPDHPKEAPKRLTLNHEEVAGLLGIAPQNFLDRRRQLEKAGFPSKLPGLGLNRWSRAAIEAWIASSGQSAMPSPDALAEARKELEARYAG